MSRRDEILEALGIMPWRLRSAEVAVDDTAAAMAAGVALLNVEERVEEPPLRVQEDDKKISRPETNPAASSSLQATPDAVAETPDSNGLSLPGAREHHIARLEWADFAADVCACTACGLCKTRTKAVPGAGDVHARWLFVGEGPGAEEDKKGEPFVGQAGRLLDQMLAAMGLKRGDDVYIANVLKCRPPNNRAPTPQEADACRPYLERQITLIQPRLIVALGKSAATLLLNTEASIASLRGRMHRYHEVPLIVTYHPAYLLRNPADKAKSWEDLVFAKRQIASMPV